MSVSVILNGMCIFYTAITCTYVTVYSLNVYKPLLTLLSAHLMLECLGKLWPLQYVEEITEGAEVLISVIMLGTVLNFKELFIMLHLTSICVIRLLA